MAQPRFDRRRLEFRSVAERRSKFEIEAIAVDPDGQPPAAGSAAGGIARTAERIRRARQAGVPVALCSGAHLVKNGLGPLVIRLVEEGWLQHVATNGAGSIHDWEFGYLGRSCEDVRSYVAEGQFGIWEETGAFLGLALLTGGLDGLGYGESIGRFMREERLTVPPREDLEALVQRARGSRLAAAAELLEAIQRLGIEPGERRVRHSHLHRSMQAACYGQGVPFTVHPGIGQDIVYTHPYFSGGAAGRAALADFLIFAETVRRLVRGGVYLSVGSSVMSPMIFEKSVAMARNLTRQEGTPFGDFHVAVVDLAPATWDWSRGEPPPEDPAYYVRFCKSFSRMGGSMEYIAADNRVFLANLYRELRSRG